MSISVCNSHFGMWTRLEPPTVETPYWHETDDGARHHVLEVLFDLDPAVALEVERLHAEAIAAITAAALAARRFRSHQESRRLASAAARLAQEIVGFWPVECTAAPAS
jgi:hypothetical protein